MQSQWNDKDAAAYPGELGKRVYSSRLLGREKSLVLHGGGNTSVKLREKNILGVEEDLLYVKGSGWDLETIETAGFVPVRLDHLIALAKLERLSDAEMVNELKTHVTVAGAPTPSVEAILHAVLPYKYVDHTHADALVSITNTVEGEARIREIYGADTVIIPYVMPGFELARLCARRYAEEAHAGSIGMVLMNHGLFSFGETARQAYERMLELVSRAEDYLKSRNAWFLSVPDEPSEDHVDIEQIVELRAAVSVAAGRPMVVACHRDPRSLAFVRRSDVAVLSQQGPATPDHVIRTKRLPLLGRDVDAYVNAYATYFNQYAPGTSTPKTMLDPAPRVILDTEFGLCCAGTSAVDAAVVADVYRHTVEVVLRANALGGYRALPAKDIFEMEYWELEQAKLRRGGGPPLFSGEVALVTGAASGIGKACVASLRERGAAVIGLDVNPSVEFLYDTPDYLGLTCDLTDADAQRRAIARGVQAFGGLDMLILNAGVFPPGCTIAELELDAWRRVMAINLDANLTLLHAAHPLLKRAPGGARVVVIGSKNVPAPGPGAAAYSASKAALNQLARVAALEWGKDGIRINTIHPNAVFDTGIWTEKVLKARADFYGLTVDEYKRRNVLGVTVESRDVAEMTAAMCSPLFAKTTGAQVPVDGGNERVI